MLQLFLSFSGVFPMVVFGTTQGDLSIREEILWPVGLPQEILVRVMPGMDQMVISAMHRRFGGDRMRRIDGFDIHRVRLEKGADIDKVIESYLASGLVAEAEPNFMRYPQAVFSPDDAYYSEQWAVNTNDARLAWSIRRPDQPVIVAVIDTGIDYTHPDLRDNIWINEVEKNGEPGVEDDGNGYVDDVYGWDFADNDADPMDKSGHGTHVAGIIGAMGNNGTGVAGISWNVRLMPLKVMGDGATAMYGSDILEALEYARKQGATVFNCSFGGPSYSGIEYSVYKSMQQTGGLVVCAAGNAGVDVDQPGKASYPASYDLANIISVAASDRGGNLGSFSNFGRKSVDLMAPGVDILSTHTGSASSVSTEAEVIQVSNGMANVASGLTFAGTTGPEGIAGTLVDCGYGYLDEMPDAVRGNIALVKRGSIDGQAFNFKDKVANVVAKGAIGAVIYNNVPGDFEGSLGSPGAWFPVVAIAGEDGETLARVAPVGIRLVNRIIDDRNLYKLMSGTSMAAPYISGLVALMRARQPDLGFAQVKSAILANAVFAPSAAGIMVSEGRVNMYNALGMMLIPGDITGDNRVTLDDLIATLHILSGIPPAAPIVFHPGASDVNADGRVGIEEGIYILDRVSR